ncbi:MAG: SCP2 sterol-binding domain-containing protein [Streptosporangiaceae bacterium]
MPTPPARSAPPAPDPISQFFNGLAQPGHLAAFESESATLRFDVRDGASVQRWRVTVHDGDVTVTRRAEPADAVVRADRPHLQAILTGRVNATAALLRGLVDCEGSMGALMMFQRCLPGPPGSTGRVAPISSQTVMAEHDQKPRRPA